MSDDAERAFLEPIKRELAREVDNSDAALIQRAGIIARRMASAGRMPYMVNVEYDNRQWLLLQISEDPPSDHAVNYFATVQFEDDPNGRNRVIGRIIAKPKDLTSKPRDPFVRYLIDETGATP